MFVQLTILLWCCIFFLQPEQTTCWWIFNTETSPPWYPVKSFLGLIPMPFWIKVTGRNMGPLSLIFKSKTHQDSAFNLFPRLARVASSHAAQKTTDKFYWIRTRGGSKKDMFFHQNGHHTPCWAGALWLRICKPCSSESGYEPLSLRGLMHMVCIE